MFNKTNHFTTKTALYEWLIKNDVNNFFFFDTKSSASIQKILDIESRKQQQKNSFLSLFKRKLK